MTTSFVTGATGFLGYAIARELLDAGHEVRALSRSGTLPGDLVERGVRVVQGDLDDLASLRGGMRGAELVFHAAADVGMWPGDWVRCYRTNVEGTRRAIEAAVAEGARRFVYTSSGSTIGKPRPHAPDVVDESSAYDFERFGMTYPHTKWLGERIVLEARGIEVVITHPTMIVGPWDWKANLLPLYRAAKGWGLLVVPGGRRTTCDVRDVARGHRLAADRGRAGERYILGGEARSSRAIFTLVANAVDGHAPRLELPDEGMLALGRLSGALGVLRGRTPVLTPEMALQSTFRTTLSSAKAERELGYTVRPLDASVADAVAWYRGRGLL